MTTQILVTQILVTRTDRTTNAQLSDRWVTATDTESAELEAYRLYPTCLVGIRRTVGARFIRRTVAALTVAAALLFSGAANAKPHHTKQLDGEVDSAKAALKVAKAQAKASKAAHRAQLSMAKTAIAIEACEQAVSDLCVLTAAHDGSTDCEAPALFRPCQGPIDAE